MTREAGVLLSVSSLPSREGIGTLGEGAYAFVDFLFKAGFRVWQVLPLTPTREGNSPYSSICENALNPLFIDLFDLVEQGLLRESEIPAPKKGKVDYPTVIAQKQRLLRLAFSRFDQSDPDFVAFEKKGEYKEYALFSALTEAFDDKPFEEWREGYSLYDPARIDAFLKERKDLYSYYVFTQFVFDREWKKLKTYANAHGVRILGDMPIYVAMNSAEVYFHPDLFLFDERRRPTDVAGVPPDYFNSEGQRWGNPLYDWDKMKKDGYRWWRERIARELTRFDMLRIDHFRGLDRYYAIAVDATDAKHGVWKQGPGAALFEGMTHLPIVAEDLGFVDESLHVMMKKVGFPGMKVFAFGLDGNPWSEHKPANYAENVVAYTGTHDNMPFRGVLEELTGHGRAAATQDVLVQATALGAPISPSLDLAKGIGAGDTPQDALQKKILWLESLSDDKYLDLDPRDLTRLACATLLRSKARLAVMPMQDILALGAESRMNTPALVSEENWAWRLDASALTDALCTELKEELILSKRA